jgi:DNA-binding response OmpR family regulator
LVIDEQTRTVTLAGEELAMTSHEFTLLQALAERPGRVLSREQLINLTRERGDEIFERAVDVQISRLRQKLGDDPKAPEWIKTVRGVGYVLAARGS